MCIQDLTCGQEAAAQAAQAPELPAEPTVAPRPALGSFSQHGQTEHLIKNAELRS